MRFVPGEVVSVCRVGRRVLGNAWRRHVVRKSIEVDEYRDGYTFGSSGARIYRFGEWLIMSRKV